MQTVSTLELQLNQYKQRMTQYYQEVNNLQQEIPSVEQQLSALKQRLEFANQRLSIEKHEVATIEAKLDEKKQQIAKDKSEFQKYPYAQECAEYIGITLDDAPVDDIIAKAHKKYFMKLAEPYFRKSFECGTRSYESSDEESDGEQSYRSDKERDSCQYGTCIGGHVDEALSDLRDVFREIKGSKTDIPYCDTRYIVQREYNMHEVGGSSYDKYYPIYVIIEELKNIFFYDKGFSIDDMDVNKYFGSHGVSGVSMFC